MATRNERRKRAKARSVDKLCKLAQAELARQAQERRELVQANIRNGFKQASLEMRAYRGSCSGVYRGEFASRAVGHGASHRV